MAEGDCKCEECEEGAPLWMVTYSDMVTLLLCFFVMELSMANFLDPGKVDAALNSMQAAFSSGGQHRTEYVHAKDSKNNDFRESSKEGAHSLIALLRDVIAAQNAKHMIKMTSKKTEVRIVFGKNGMFSPGSAAIDPAYFSVLKEIALTLRDRDVYVVVEGHADTDGTNEAKNWQVSADRAITVVNKLRSYRDLEYEGEPFLKGRQISARAMGEFFPASPSSGSNDLNRRVEIVIRGESLQALDAAKELEQNSGGVYGR
jgi:chemotaxis protein MotB